MDKSAELERHARWGFEAIMETADPELTRDGYGYLNPITDACWKFFLHGWNAACSY